MHRTSRCCAAVALAVCLAASPRVLAQEGGRGGRGAAPTPRASAPVDLTGYWVSVISEDWPYRMVTPPRGDRSNIPLNAQGAAVVKAWDAAKDEAAGESCKSYGAPGVMRVPGRVRITWADDTSLRVETEAGTQTRMLRFTAAAPSATPDWQGASSATWEFAGGRRGGGPAPRRGALKIVTTHMRPGYLQKNGVPYSANAVLTEYFNRISEPNGDSWLIITTIVEDPQYLTVPFIRSTHFKKLPDTSAWEPEVCSAR